MRPGTHKKPAKDPQEAEKGFYARMDEELARLQGLASSLASQPAPPAHDNAAKQLTRLPPSKGVRRPRPTTGASRPEQLYSSAPSLSPAPPPAHPPHVPPPPPQRKWVPPAQPAGKMRAIMEEAWLLAQADQEEWRREKEWAMRRDRALRRRLAEYEQRRRGETEQGWRAALCGLSDSLGQDGERQAAALVLDLQHETTLLLKQLQAQAHQAFLLEVEAIRTEAKRAVAGRVRVMRDARRAQREVEVAARREELVQEREALLRDMEARASEEDEREAEGLRAELESCGEEADRLVEASFAEHVRVECEAEVARWEEGREERRAVVEAEEDQRLDHVLRRLRAGLAAWGAAAREGIHAEVMGVTKRLGQRGEEGEGDGGMGEEGVREEEEEEEGRGEGEAVRRLERAADWLELRCGRLSLELGRLGEGDARGEEGAEEGRGGGVGARGGVGWAGGQRQRRRGWGRVMSLCMTQLYDEQ